MGDLTREREVLLILYPDMLYCDNTVHPTVWQWFVEGLYLLQHDNTAVHNTGSIKKSFF